MKPFDDYPKQGQELLGKLKWHDTNCRRGYGRDLQRRTGQTRCAYCGVSLVDDYYHWLLMCIDHVVPQAEAKRLGIPDEFTYDVVNMTLCCSGCNGFGNKQVLFDEKRRDKWTLKDFLKLRDKVFMQRKHSIGERRMDEMDFYDHRPWEFYQKAA